jgi:outer membrane protein TolC
MSRASTIVALAISLLATGCAQLSPHRGFEPVSKLASERLGKEVRLVRNDADNAALASLLGQKLAAPLQADDAVQIALLNNRALQAIYWNVGIAEADLVQAGRLHNPVFNFERTNRGGDVDVERSLTLNLASVLVAPLAQRIEQRRYQQTWLTVADAMLEHAAATRRAYFEAVAATQSTVYARQVLASAEASAELSGRMAQAGNFSQLDLAREQLFRAESAAAVVRADKHAVATREALTRLMGLWGDDAASYRLPERLPDLPAAPAALNDIERIAVRERLDIQAATIESQQTAASLGLSRTTRLINVLDLGYLRYTNGGQTAPGYAISLELPLFDWGGAQVAKAEAIYMQALAKVAQTAVVARSEARESYLDYRASYDLAKHYRDEVIPLRKKIADETQLRYNGMLISVFELLADAREQARAVSSTIDAQKDFWIAHTNLETALGGRLPAAGAVDKDITP